LLSKVFPTLRGAEIPWHFGTINLTKSGPNQGVSLINQHWLGSYLCGRLQCRLTRGEKTMQGLKGVVVVATILAAAVSLGACRKEVAEQPLKLGAADVVVAVR
jgi:hypothetical protein